MSAVLKWLSLWGVGINSALFCIVTYQEEGTSDLLQMVLTNNHFAQNTFCMGTVKSWLKPLNKADMLAKTNDCQVMTYINTPTFDWRAQSYALAREATWCFYTDLHQISSLLRRTGCGPFRSSRASRLQGQNPPLPSSGQHGWTQEFVHLSPKRERYSWPGFHIFRWGCPNA